MTYWWVYQGQSFARARMGGYLWAPDATTAGGTPYYYWTNVMQVEVGDLIFSHVEGRIIAVGIATGAPYAAPAPDPQDSSWHQTGFRVDVAFRDLTKPIAFAEARHAIKDFPEGRESPFAANGRPNQGFLFKLSDAAGVRLGEMVYSNDGPLLTSLPPFGLGGQAPIPNTSAQATIMVRLGQARFRRLLDQKWGERCCVTSLGVRDLLRASHIKRWSDACDQERLDPFNGLLLSAAYDAAFDRGLISFNDDGTVIVSGMLTGEGARQAGIEPMARIVGIGSAHHPYLAYHRGHYFAG